MTRLCIEEFRDFLKCQTLEQQLVWAKPVHSRGCSRAASENIGMPFSQECILKFKPFPNSHNVRSIMSFKGIFHRNGSMTRSRTSFKDSRSSGTVLRLGTRWRITV